MTYKDKLLAMHPSLAVAFIDEKISDCRNKKNYCIEWKTRCQGQTSEEWNNKIIELTELRKQIKSNA